MRKFAKITCPHCGTENKMYIKEGSSIIVCDIDNGGCDKDFAIKTEFEVKVKVFKLQEVRVGNEN